MDIRLKQQEAQLMLTNPRDLFMPEIEHDIRLRKMSHDLETGLEVIQGHGKWLSGKVVVHINEVTLRRARLVQGWVKINQCQFTLILKLLREFYR